MVMTAAVLFGLNGSISRLLFDDGITPLTSIEFRMLIGGLCLMLVLVIGQRNGLKVQRRYWGWLVALRCLDAMRVGIVNMLELPAAGIIAYLWLGQRLDVWQIIGCVLVLVGIVILQYEQSSKIQPVEKLISYSH